MVERVSSIAASQALSQIDLIGRLCDFLEHLAIEKAAEQAVPCTMPRTVGGLGFDVPLWTGLGVVGLWSALDAFAERHGQSNQRCSICQRHCLGTRLVNIPALDASLRNAADELEDIRHLFAHNFAGYADECYFGRPRHVLRSNQQITLSCGAQLSGIGQTLRMNVDHLRFYVDCASRLLQTINNA